MSTSDVLAARIKALCEAKGYAFKPWEEPPWSADSEECPWPPQSSGAQSWPKARKLRAQLIAEIEGTDDGR